MIAFVLALASVSLALGLGYAMGIARFPYVEAVVVGFAFGMGWNAVMAWSVRKIGRFVR